MSPFYVFPSVSPVAGLLLHLHQRVGAQGSSGTLYEGTSASFFTSGSTLCSGRSVDDRSFSTLVLADFCSFILFFDKAAIDLDSCGLRVNLRWESTGV